MINWNEYNIIEDKVKRTSDKLTQTNNVNEQLTIITDLFSWLNDNGQYILLDDETRKLKTKDKHIQTYITKWGIRFKIIKDIKYHKCTSCQMKILRGLLFKS